MILVLILFSVFVLFFVLGLYLYIKGKEEAIKEPFPILYYRIKKGQMMKHNGNMIKALDNIPSAWETYDTWENILTRMLEIPSATANNWIKDETLFEKEYR